MVQYLIHDRDAFYSWQNVRMTPLSHSLLEEEPSGLIMSSNDDILQKRLEKLTEGMSNIPKRKIGALRGE